MDNSNSTKEKNLNRFQSLFWDAFHVPALESPAFNKIFQELEPLNDLIAGPLFSILEQGHCDYVFASDGRFKGVNTPDDFFEWITESIKEYAEKISNMKTGNEQEEKDLQTLLFQSDIKMELAELAYRIIQK